MELFPKFLDLKQQLGSVVLRVVVDAYFCKVPFLAPLVSAGIVVVTRMRKDAVAWDERIESETKKKTVKMEGEWKLARLLEQFTPQKLSVKIYGKLVQVEAVEREVFIRGFQPKVTTRAFPCPEHGAGLVQLRALDKRLSAARGRSSKSSSPRELKNRLFSCQLI